MNVDRVIFISHSYQFPVSSFGFQFERGNKKGKKVAKKDKKLFWVAPHLTVDCIIGGKWKYEINEK